MSKVAAVQMASGPNIQANLDQAKRLIEDAANRSPVRMRGIVMRSSLYTCRW